MLDDIRQPVIERIGRFTGLEEDIRILGRSAKNRTFRIHRPTAVCVNRLLVDHGPDIVDRQLLDLVHFVRRAKAIEEVKKRDARRERGGLGHQRKVVRFLNRVGGQHGPPRASHGHHVAVIAKNRKCMRRQGAGRDVKHGRRQFARDLEHVGDHQQQALGRRECRRQRAGLQDPVNDARGARLALHFDHVRDRPENVDPARRRPGIGKFAHRRGRRNRVYRNHFVGLMGHHRCRFVAVQGHKSVLAHVSILPSLFNPSTSAAEPPHSDTHGLPVATQVPKPTRSVDSTRNRIARRRGRPPRHTLAESRRLRGSVIGRLP